MYEFLATEISETVSAPTIPAAPTGLTATADSDSIGLSWTNGDTYSTIRIDRKTTGDYTALATAAGNATSYDDTTAVTGTTYTYKVKGVKTTYPSPYSNTASDTILSSPHSGVFDGVDGLLSNTDPTDLHLTNTDAIIIGFWMNVSDFNDERGLLSKTDSLTGGNEFFIYLDSTANLHISFRTSATGTSSTTSDFDLTGNVFIVCWINPNAGTPQLGIDINGSNNDTTNYGSSTAFASTGGVFQIGAAPLIAESFLGKLDEVFICLNPPNFATALSTINSSIYNSGSGKLYSAVSSANKTAIGLAHWWGLDEVSGTRVDLHGTDNLTASGGISSGTAIVS